VAVLSLAGNLLNVNPHVHMIVSDGAFSQSGERFVSADPELWKHLKKAFRHKVLNELRKRGHISPEVQKNMLSWNHSGFSVFAASSKPTASTPTWSGASGPRRAPKRP